MRAVRHFGIRSRARALGVAMLFVWTSLAWGQEPVAELTVTAFGAQRFDLASGRTVLTDGGEVTDRASGVHLVATWIAYVEGELLEARDATVDGALGSLRAAVVVIDLVGGRLIASGGVVLERGGLAATAARFGFDAPAGLAWLAGDVVAASPDAAAATAWIDVRDGRVMLVGPYRYVDGLFALDGAEGARLQLDPLGADAVGYDARTEVDADLSARVAELAALAAEPHVPPQGP